MAIRPAALLSAMMWSVSALYASAATIQSNGTGGGDWTLTSTWDGGVVPIAADDVTILASDSITISSGPVTVDSGGSITNNGIVTVSADQLLQVIDGTVTTSTIGSRLIVQTGAEMVIEFAGTLNVLDGFVDVSGRLDNLGTVFIDGSSSNDGRIRIEPSGTLTNQSQISSGQGSGPTTGSEFGIANRGTLANEQSGMIDVRGNGAIASISNEGTFYNRGTLTTYPSGGWVVWRIFINEETGVVQNDGIVYMDALLSGNCFARNDGLIVNNDTINASLGSNSVILNTFCGHLQNNGAITNSGVISNCGLIDGTTGIGGISGAGTISADCGGNSPTGTITVRLTESGSGDPVPDATVFLERACIPIGGRVAFAGVNGGAAEFFRGAVEPAQYEIKAFAPGYAPVSGVLVAVASTVDVVRDIALIPDPDAVNTIEVTITADTGGSLLTDDFALSQDNGETTFRPTVTFDGPVMNLVGLGPGNISINAMLPGYAVDSENVIIEPTAPGTFSQSLNGTADVNYGTANGNIDLGAPAQDPSGFTVHFTPTSGGAASEFTDNLAGLTDYIAPRPGFPNELRFIALALPAGEYFVTASKAGGAITSQTVDATIVFNEVTEVLPKLTVLIQGDDPDRDGLPTWWEDAGGLESDSSAPVNGALDDKEPDGLTNAEEFGLNTEEFELTVNPSSMDSDGDTYPDGFERYAGSNVKVPDTPPLRQEVFVRHTYSGIIRVGSQTRPMVSFGNALNRVASGGAITFQNDGFQTIHFPGSHTITTPLTLRILNNNAHGGPPVRVGASN